MNKIDIQKITLSDIPQIVALVNTILKIDYAPIYKKETIEAYKRLFTRKYFEKLFKNSGSGFGVFDQKNLIGFVLLKKEMGGIGYIEWLCVHAHYRKRGVASQLLVKIEKEALNLKLHGLYFHTETKTNIAFYEKRGYKQIGVLRKFWFGEDEYILSKQLRDEPFPEVFRINI